MKDKLTATRGCLCCSSGCVCSKRGTPEAYGVERRKRSRHPRRSIVFLFLSRHISFSFRFFPVIRGFQGAHRLVHPLRPGACATHRLGHQRGATGVGPSAGESRRPNVDHPWNEEYTAGWGSSGVWSLTHPDCPMHNHVAAYIVVSRCKC